MIIERVPNILKLLLLTLLEIRIHVLIFMQVLGFFHGDDITAFDNLVHLKLGIDRTQDWYWLPNLLVSSPKLEVLHFEEVTHQTYFEMGSYS